MKREDVKKQIPNITDEQLDWLMGENGRDITAEKTKATNLQIQVNGLTTQLNTAKDSLKAFEGVDVADLKGQITKLQGQLADQADSFAFDSALDGAIRDAHGRDVKAIRGMLDRDLPVSAIVLEAWKGRYETGEFNKFAHGDWNADEYYAFCRERGIQTVLWQVPVIPPSHPGIQDLAAAAAWLESGPER